MQCVLSRLDLGAKAQAGAAVHFCLLLGASDGTRQRALSEDRAIALYQSLWGDVVQIEKTGVTKIATKQTGWKLATSVGGVGTGERADIVLIDDVNNVKEAESQAVRNATNIWLTEMIPTRLSDPQRSAIVNIQQRTHEDGPANALGLSGHVLEFATRSPAIPQGRPEAPRRSPSTPSASP